jgi:Ca-activated chloride channel family protein
MGNFLNPLAAIFAITLPIIVLMYLLKLKRTRIVLSSTMLWRKSIEDLIANAPFQKLRRNLLLYLQLLIAALLVLALMRPLLNMQGGAGKKYIMLIDVSASMKATDAEGGLTRIAEARDKAEQLVNQMAKGDTMTLLSFAHQTTPVQNQTADKTLLRSKIKGLEAVDTGTNITEALIIADSLARPEYQQGGQIEDTGDASLFDPRSRIVIVSDGNFGAKQLQMAEASNVRFIQVGASDNNVGITAMDISIDLEGAAGPIVFAAVKNFSSQPNNRLLRLYLDDSEAELDVKALSLDAGQETTVRFKPFGENAEDVTTETMAVPHKVRLALAPYSDEDTADVFAIDDEAYGIIKPLQPTRILVVTSGNSWLEDMLTLIPNSRIEKVSSANYRPSDEYDITFFDGYSPAELGVGNYFFLHAIPQLPGFALEVDESGRPVAELERPFITDWNRVHLLTRFVNFDNVAIGQALAIKPPPWARVMVESDLGPIILAFEREGVRGVVIALDFNSSDWGLDISYPIFMSNTVRWLSQSAKAIEQPVLRTGSTLPLQPKQEVETFTVVNPAGDSYSIPIEDGKAYSFIDTEQIGFYEVSSSNSEEKNLLAFNLLSLEESEVAPRKELQIGRETVTAGDSVLTSNREIWRYLLWAALAVLVLEWFVYCRRSWT